MNVTGANVREGPLALICGGGTLPLAVADLVAARGRQVLLLPLRGFSDPAIYRDRPHHWIYFGQAGRVMRLMRAANCRDIALIGSVVRPALWQIRPDWLGLTLMWRIAPAFRGGDDHLLSAISRMIEARGFHLLGVHEIAPEILMPKGALGSVLPSERDRIDIALGFHYLRAAGPFDVGQAVVVADRRVLAVEAAEGTDQMLARVAQLRDEGRISLPSGHGVLVKAAKPAQDRRLDLPSIGPTTIDGIARAGLAGVAVTAAETVIAEAAEVTAKADRANIFVIGADAGDYA